MFAPIGYTPVSSLWSVAKAQYLETCEKIRIERTQKFSHPDDFGLPSYFTACDFLEVFFVGTLPGYLFASSSDGRVFRVDGRFLDFSCYLHISDCIFSLKESNQLEVISDSLSIFSETMAFHYYISKVAEAKEKIKKGFYPKDSGFNSSFRSEHARTSLYYSRPDFIISRKIYDAIKNEGELGVRFSQENLNFMKTFDGFSLCVDDVYVETEWATRMHDSVKRAAQMTSPESRETEAAQVGRPPEKRDAAFEAYLTLYPNGAVDQSLKEVTRTVSEAIGFTISSDPMRRAIQRANSGE